jgi:hypothetical protein
MPNICINTINITYYEVEEKELKKISRAIRDKIDERFLIYKMWGKDDTPYHLDEPVIITNYEFGSDWVAPLEFLDQLCIDHNVDICGVAYEFEDGYVESFELQNRMEDGTLETHWVSMEAEDRENTTTLPLSGDESVLDEDINFELPPDEQILE